MSSIIDDTAELHFFGEAVTMARSLDAQNPDKIRTLCKIAEARSKAGLKDDARKTFAEAVNAARQIKELPKQSQSLREIAVALAEFEKEYKTPAAAACRQVETQPAAKTKR